MILSVCVMSSVRFEKYVEFALIGLLLGDRT
jgi:hypothetical protein